MNALLSNTTVSAASRTAGSTSLPDSPSGPSQTWSHTIQVHTLTQIQPVIVCEVAGFVLHDTNSFEEMFQSCTHTRGGLQSCQFL